MRVTLRMIRALYWSLEPYGTALAVVIGALTAVGLVPCFARLGLRLRRVGRVVVVLLIIGSS